jgi:hypothetical protein
MTFGKYVFFPVLAIEEPEAHLHPNAQKQLYSQINSIAGQKIISTHSPYIAAVAELGQIRNFYKDHRVHCGRVAIDVLEDDEAQRKIERQVINTRGEIFFSKLMVFFEGETEEQALPIFAKCHFGQSGVEMGIDFVGVGRKQWIFLFHFESHLLPIVFQSHYHHLGKLLHQTLFLMKRHNPSPFEIKYLLLSPAATGKVIITRYCW